MSQTALLRDLPTHHFLRRTARAKLAAYQHEFPARQFQVVSSLRGPFGWRVEEVPAPRPAGSSLHQ